MRTKQKTNKSTIQHTAKKLTRRSFLGGTAVVGLTVVGLGSLACGGEKELNCSTPSGLTDQQRQLRQQLRYVDKSGDPNKNCANCNFYTKPAQTGQCGGCTLNLGPVNPAGNCTSWVEKTG